MASRFRDEYVRLTDELNDVRLPAIASERMRVYDLTTLISEEEMDRRLSISQAESDAAGEAEFERTGKSAICRKRTGIWLYK